MNRHKLQEPMQLRIGTSFSQQELDRMDEWGFANKIRTRSEVIRRLVGQALDQAEMKTATD